MFSVLGSVPTSLANPFKSLALDDHFSRFNRLYLFAFAIISGVVVTINDLAGEKIECHGFDIFEHDFHENYCWTQGIYTILEAYDLPDESIPYPGILPENTPCFDFFYPNGTQYTCPAADSLLPLTRVYHLWYQWIPFYFWICAAVFYAPYIFFHHSDIGSLKPMLKLLVEDIVDSTEDEEKKMERASGWLARKLHVYLRAKGPMQWVLVKHKFYFILLLTKMANLAVVLFVLYATNNIFSVTPFARYGYDWIIYVTGNREPHDDSPIDKLFPKMTACEVKKWGTTGIVNEAGMCVLAPNVVNSYFFLIFWFVLVLGVAINLVALLLASLSYIFTLGRWKSLLASSFIKSGEAEKWVYFTSGTSGQITLEIISSNLPPRKFEKLFKKTSQKLSLLVKNEVNVYSNQRATSA